MDTCARLKEHHKRHCHSQKIRVVPWSDFFFDQLRPGSSQETIACPIGASVHHNLSISSIFRHWRKNYLDEEPLRFCFIFFLKIQQTHKKIVSEILSPLSISCLRLLPPSITKQQRFFFFTTGQLEKRGGTRSDLSQLCNFWKWETRGLS